MGDGACPNRSFTPSRLALATIAMSAMRAPSKDRGPVQRAIRRAFAASDTEVLTSSSIYAGHTSAAGGVAASQCRSVSIRERCGRCGRCVSRLSACRRMARAQQRGRLRGVWKNPHENMLHDLNKTGLFRDRFRCMIVHCMILLRMASPHPSGAALAVPMQLR